MLRTFIDTARDYFDRYFLLRWTIANMVGWSLGLFLGSVVLQLIGGIVGLLIGGLVAGGIAGYCQWWVLQLSLHWLERRWIFYSALAGFLAAFPAFLLGFLSIFNMGFAGFIIGGLFGGLVGALQGFVIRYEFDHVLMMWGIANVLAGAICGSLILVFLPIICIPGPLLYGLITGWMLLRLFRQLPEDMLEK